MGPRETARSKDVTANSTEKVGKAGKAGQRPWEIEKYTYKKETIDDNRSSHSDPRLELAQQSHGQHQDSHFISSDGDPASLHPAFSLDTTPDLSARASFANDQGTLAGGSESAPQHHRKGSPHLFNHNAPLRFRLHLEKKGTNSTPQRGCKWDMPNRSAT
jgi:hypothetical protein